MSEPEFSRVQRLAVKMQFLEELAVTPLRAAIDRIAEQRVTHRRHVDTDLVSASCLEPAFDQSGVPKHTQPLPVSYRAPAAPAFDDRDLLAVCSRAGERGVNRALSGLGHAVDDRQVAPVDRMGGELL